VQVQWQKIRIERPADDAIPVASSAVGTCPGFGWESHIHYEYPEGRFVAAPTCANLSLEMYKFVITFLPGTGRTGKAHRGRSAPLRYRPYNSRLTKKGAQLFAFFYNRDEALKWLGVKRMLGCYGGYHDSPTAREVCSLDPP